MEIIFVRPSNAQGKRRRSTEGAQGTDMGHKNAEGMAHVGVRLTAQLGDGEPMPFGRSGHALLRKTIV